MTHNDRFTTLSHIRCYYEVGDAESGGRTAAVMPGQPDSRTAGQPDSRTAGDWITAFATYVDARPSGEILPAEFSIIPIY